MPPSFKLTERKYEKAYSERTLVIRHIFPIIQLIHIVQNKERSSQ